MVPNTAAIPQGGYLILTIMRPQEFLSNPELITSEYLFYGYEDVRLSGEKAGQVFYVGVGGKHRVKTRGREHNRYHGNVVKKHGFTRRIAFRSCEYDEVNQWEIARIAELRGAGVALTNVTGGGGGVLGIATIKNVITGETKRWLKDVEYPDGWVHNSTGQVTLRNLATGETKRFPTDQPYPDGWVHNSTGQVTLRNLATGDHKNFHKDQPYPDGWVHNSTGQVTLRNLATGETKRFPTDQPYPKGWVPNSAGTTPMRNVVTGECKRFPTDQPYPDGWVPVTTTGDVWHVTLLNPLTGEERQHQNGFPRPTGWEYVRALQGDKHVLDAAFDCLVELPQTTGRIDCVRALGMLNIPGYGMLVRKFARNILEELRPEIGAGTFNRQFAEARRDAGIWAADAAATRRAAGVPTVAPKPGSNQRPASNLACSPCTHPDSNE